MANALAKNKTQSLAPMTPIESMKSVINMPSVQEQFKNALADTAPLFIASLIDVFGSDGYLQQCEPKAVIMEALKAATLKLPLNKGLGFAYLLPFKNKGKMTPTFCVGWKGYVQLAMRSGQYKIINVGMVYDGELRSIDKLSGEVDLGGQKKSDEVVAYFSHFKLINGFTKTLVWTKESVYLHAERYSRAFQYDLREKKQLSLWSTDFDSQAMKTMIRQILSKWGILSVEMISAIANDKEEYDEEAETVRKIKNNANTGPVLDFDSADQGGPDQAEDQKRPAAISQKGQDNQENTPEMVACPAREGDKIMVEYCDTKCKSRPGCPAFDDGNGGGAEDMPDFA